MTSGGHGKSGIWKGTKACHKCTNQAPRKKKKEALNQKLLIGKLDNLAEKERHNIEFVVEHRAGSKIGHVDALSPHVGAILEEGILDRKNILQEQAKNAFCTKQAQGHINARKNFSVNDGILYKRRSNGNHQLVVPQSLIWEVIKENHDPVFVVHPEVKRTQYLI